MVYKYKVIFKTKEENTVLCIVNSGYVEYLAFINNIPTLSDTSDVPFLEDVECIYHCIDNVTNESYPCYYEYDGELVLKINNAYGVKFYDNYRKDYTLINIKTLDDMIL